MTGHRPPAAARPAGTPAATGRAAPDVSPAAGPDETPAATGRAAPDVRAPTTREPAGSGRTVPGVPALTAGEIAYLGARRLGRLATVAPDGAPQVNPVSCYYNPATGTIDIGGHAMAASRKFRNVRANPRVAVVVDDMPGGMETIRCLEIRGTAEAIEAPDDSAARAPGAIIRIRPRRVISWGIDPPHLACGARDVRPGEG
ncbi:hypothetical protein Sru01_43410 [Sphaerisporangium rufum]|uniref:Pyridoxamine 5'-phosphate oxidase N-terminal domain-containing protein n=1 Tax=Sphaerisporangium rufum TaxID=1381558 RepID=A0A919R458_9ACTN|nr:PPOX class F420-dependent oxidoreductase [Sphaerisporangium rufum]GII79359.1 hypothetical protein Sru01_43410 [Sphaerisporangium rufum]